MTEGKCDHCGTEIVLYAFQVEDGVDFLLACPECDALDQGEAIRRDDVVDDDESDES